MSRADALIVITAAFKKILADAGMDPERIHVIQNTADTEIFRRDTKPAVHPWTDEQGDTTLIKRCLVVCTVRVCW